MFTLIRTILQTSFSRNNYFCTQLKMSKRPSSDLAKFREEFKNSKHVVVLTGKKNLSTMLLEESKKCVLAGLICVIGIEDKINN